MAIRSAQIERASERASEEKWQIFCVLQASKRMKFMVLNLVQPRVYKYKPK